MNAQDLLDELIERCTNDMLVNFSTPGGNPHDPDPRISELRDILRADLNSGYNWHKIDTFTGDMFTILSDGTPEGTEVYKYKGNLPSWATHWKPIEFDFTGWNLEETEKK